MKTKKRGMKFAALQTVLKDNPGLSPAEVVAKVKSDHNLKVSLASVQRVKQKLAGNLPPSIRDRSKTSVAVPVVATIPVDDLLKVKAFAAQVGGVDPLIALAQTLKKVAA